MPPKIPRPLIAIVGRPNVGKSTLFNRLVRRRLAIVEDTPGVTRDRHYADCELDSRPVTLIDTGGFVPERREDPLADDVRNQARAAVEECDLILFVVDGRAGLTGGDQEVARFLRKQQRPLLLVVNKVDGLRNEETVIAEFHKLGLGEPIAVSAEHNNGIEDLVVQSLGKLPRQEPAAPLAPEDIFVPREEGDEREDEVLPERPPRPIRLAIVGRPNVGKSTLVNALLGESRVVVSPIAGTTRDSVDSDLTWRGRELVLTDTAGIRKKSAISQKVEHFSVLFAMRAIESSDVAVLVLDATEAAVAQDQKIAALAEEKGRALLLVVNKWDLKNPDWTENEFRNHLKWELSWLAWVPMIFISAKDGKKIEKVLDAAIEVADQLHFRAPTPMLNRILEHITTEHPLPVAKGRRLKLYYAAQVGISPPAFAFTCNMPTAVPDRYERYVSNYLRQAFRLKVPIRLFFRERPGGKQRAIRAQTFKSRAESKAKGRRR